MKLMLVLSILLLTLFSAPVNAMDIYGKLGIGMGTLQKPDISAPAGSSESDLDEGGFSFILQALLGEEKLKYGAEFGIMKIYEEEWETPTIGEENKLLLVPFIGILQYEFVQGNLVPYITWGAGFYIAAKHNAAHVPGVPGDDKAASNTVYGGASIGAGLKHQISKKLYLDATIRYSSINAQGGVSIINYYLGVGTMFRSSPQKEFKLRMKDTPRK